AGIPNAVVGNAVLRKVVGADFLAAITAADKATALGGKFGLLLLDFLLQQPRAQHAHGLLFVFDLRFFILVGNDHAGGQVGDAHRAIRRVDALATVATRTVDVDFEVARANLDIGFFGLGQ